MDQEQASEALNPSTSISGKKLNAKAPEFVPRSGSSAAAPPPPPPTLLQPVYARPPSFVPPLPPPYYGYENYYQQNVTPFYGYNVSPVGPVEFVADGKNGSSTTTATAKMGCQIHTRKLLISVYIFKLLNFQSEDKTVKFGPCVDMRMLTVVEFYFSDINLATTDQLFRFMSKDPEGYVPLSVVASFKKIKTAITDSTQLASILQSSNKLSRIVIAENLPEDHSHQNLMKIFSSVGSVKSIRTCPPQNSNGGGSSASKSGKGDGLNISGKFHAFVEYESVEAAEKAVTELKDEANWRNGLKVRLLLKSAVKPTQTRTKKAGHEGQTSGKKDEASVSEIKEKDLEDSSPQSDAQNHELPLEENKTKSNVQRKVRNNVGGSGKGKGRGHSRGRPHHPTNGGNVLGYPPLEISGNTEKMNIAKGSSVPRMPDGTKGFSVGRGKSVAV
ncbi:hypothetical protein DH2020_049518 [Rehmannia glutinosa]|uniref:Uncharacterized protein n=1 Tax=Rehmannia glutinosa TaxID=99300 RepID=A0ABR0U3U5_REHGL